MTVINSTHENTPNARVRIAQEHALTDKNDVYLEVKSDIGEVGYGALTVGDTYDIIVALAEQAGLVKVEPWGREDQITVVRPVDARKARRAELNNMGHSDLLDLILDLEEASGKL